MTAVDALGNRKKPDGQKDQRNDPLIVKTIIDAITVGNSYATAITLAGIGERTFYRWMAQGQRAKRDTLARQFWQKVRLAEATAMHRNVLLVQQAARKDWRAALKFLEVKDPENWAPKEKVEHTGASGAPIQVNMQVRSRFLSALERAYGSGSQSAPVESGEGGEKKEGG